MEDASGGSSGCARSSTASSRWTAASTQDNVGRCATRAPTCSSPAAAIFAREDLARAYRAPGTSAGMSLQRALELAEQRAARAYPKPTVGAVVVRDGEIVGEGVTEADEAAHGEVVALEAAGERARGATLYVTMEPCAHHGTTPPCVDAILAAGVARVVAGSLDPNPEAGRRARAAARPRASRSSSPTRRGAAPERGLADLGRAGPAVRHLQGGGHARRPRHRPRLALGLRRGVAPARARAARGLGRRRRRDGHGAAREPAPRRARRRRDAAAAAARVRPRPAPRGLRARAALRRRSRTSSARSRPRACSRCCSRAGRRSPAPSSAPASSTSCSSSSRRCSPARAGPRRRPRRAARARPRLASPAGRRGRAARGVPARAVTFRRVHRARARGGRGRLVRGRPARRRLRNEPPRSATRSRSTASA